MTGLEALESVLKNGSVRGYDAIQLVDLLDEAGFVIVPREATKEMLKAGIIPIALEDAWKSMIEAAP